MIYKIIVYNLYNVQATIIKAFAARTITLKGKNLTVNIMEAILNTYLKFTLKQ